MLYDKAYMCAVAVLKISVCCFSTQKPTLTKFCTPGPK